MPDLYWYANDHGRYIYWAAFSVMAAATIVFFLLSFQRKLFMREVYQISGFITAIAAIAYYSMANWYGSVGPNIYNEEFGYNGQPSPSYSYPLGVAQNVPTNASYYREIFWARYIDWFFTTPLLLWHLFSLVRVSYKTIMTVIFADLVMIVTGLFGALSPSGAKWGYYAMGCIAFLYVVFAIMFYGGVASRTSLIGRGWYWTLAVYLLILWVLYPINWGFCEGGNVFAVDLEIAFYAGLDVLAKVGFGILVLLATRRARKVYLERQNRTELPVLGGPGQTLVAAPGTTVVAAPVGNYNAAAYPAVAVNEGVPATVV